METRGEHHISWSVIVLVRGLSAPTVRYPVSQLHGSGQLSFSSQHRLTLFVNCCVLLPGIIVGPEMRCERVLRSVAIVVSQEES
jgi:hypothetical protein